MSYWTASPPAREIRIEFGGTQRSFLLSFLAFWQKLAQKCSKWNWDRFLGGKIFRPGALQPGQIWSNDRTTVHERGVGPTPHLP